LAQLLLAAARRQRLADGLRFGLQVPQVSLELAAAFLLAEEAALKPRSIAAAAARTALLPARAAAAAMSAVTAAATAMAAALMAATTAATTATLSVSAAVVAMMAAASAAALSSPFALVTVHSLLLLLGSFRQHLSVGVAHAGGVSFAVLT
jgi:hypothetical protein